MVLQRGLPAGGNEPGISGDDGGLGAGRKQGPSESDGHKPDTVPWQPFAAPGDVIKYLYSYDEFALSWIETLYIPLPGCFPISML